MKSKEINNNNNELTPNDRNNFYICIKIYIKIFIVTISYLKIFTPGRPGPAAETITAKVKSVLSVPLSFVWFHWFIPLSMLFKSQFFFNTVFYVRMFGILTVLATEKMP